MRAKPILIIAVIAFFYTSSAYAQLSSNGLLDQVINEFATRATAWQTVIMNAAMWLFWTLGTISLVWTFGMMALRKADLGEFFAEFIRFILFFGFMLWLLRNGPNFADSIIKSLRQLGEQASGTRGLSPSGIIDVGFKVMSDTIGHLSPITPIDNAASLLMSAVILLMLATIAINMMVLLITGWMLMYAGIFFLGFGGSRWTSDIAINYYKNVLSLATQLFAMILLIGIGSDLLTSFYSKMEKEGLRLEQLAVMLVASFALLLLIREIPSRLSGIVFGGGGGGGSIGFGAGAVAGAAMGAASVAASVATAGAANIAGGTQALMAAVKKAQSDNSGSSGGHGGGKGGIKSDIPGVSPLAAAMGDMGRIASGTASNLAKGAWDAAKEKASGMKDSAMDRISETAGGKIASAIKASTASSSGSSGSESAASGGNPFANSQETELDEEAEIAAFRDSRTT